MSTKKIQKIQFDHYISNVVISEMLNIPCVILLSI